MSFLKERKDDFEGIAFGLVFVTVKYWTLVVITDRGLQ